MKYNLPLSKMAKVGVSRSVLYDKGIVDFKSDLRAMVAAFGADHISKVALIFEAQFKAQLKKTAGKKATKPRVRIAADTRVVEEHFDDENIYGLPSIKQSIEEDKRGKRQRAR